EDLAGTRPGLVGLQPDARGLRIEHRLPAAPLRALVAAPRRGDRDDRQHRDLDDLDGSGASILGCLRFPGRLVVGAHVNGGPGNPLIARAITMIAVMSDRTDSASMAIFAQAWMGNVSVGLNAVAFVNE